MSIKGCCINLKFNIKKFKVDIEILESLHNYEVEHTI